MANSPLLSASTWEFAALDGSSMILFWEAQDKQQDGQARYTTFKV
jgi:hypothetical protein